MMYLLRDIFRDVIDMAKEAGIWQTLTLHEKEEIVSYFLSHFDALMKEAGWQRFSRMMTSYTSAGQMPGGHEEGNHDEDELLGV